MNAYNFATLLFAFCSFFLGLLVWLKRPDAVGKIYFIFNTVCALWGLGYSLMISEGVSYEKALSSVRIADAACIFIPVLWLHFILIFAKRAQENRRLLILFYSVASILISFSGSPWFIPEVKPIWIFPYYKRAGFIFHLFVIFFLIVVPIGYWHLYKKIKQANHLERSQLYGFAIASVFGFLGGALSLLPAYGFDIPQYSLFMIPFYPFVMSYFVMRGNLFDLHDLAEIVHRDKLASMSTLAASINHEIRNPLYVIRSQAEICLEKIASKGTANLKPDDLHGALSGMITQSNRALEIIKKFSGFAKRNTDEALKPEWVSLKEAVVNVLPLLAHEMELETIQFICNIPEDFQKVYADPRHLEEIFFNLISNACQTLKNTDGMIRVDAKAAGDKVRVTVADNGPGIEAGALERIFEPFYTTKTDGTGLGLYITKQLVEKNGGTISVESAAGKGTTFVLLFGIK